MTNRELQFQKGLITEDEKERLEDEDFADEAYGDQMNCYYDNLGLGYNMKRERFIKHRVD